VRVSLAGNRLRSAGLQHIAEFLATDPPLRHLNLRSNFFKVAGVRALVAALLVNTHLDSLDIRTSSRANTFELGTPYPVAVQGRIPGFPVAAAAAGLVGDSEDGGRGRHMRPRRARANAQDTRRAERWA